MRIFHITVRGPAGVLAKFGSLSASSGTAEAAARELYSIPVGVSVRPAGERAR